ncbi:hypothetical protein ACP5WL_05445 [Enterocloster bolteae]|uniref:hypothetical protein n=1 Tax=Enterocloster bolteae TaxID=208479 RepID=UPI004068DCFA
MRIYNRKKRAISLVMAIMVMSSSIQITGLAEGEKEEGKKIIISEFQELPEELSSMKVPEGTSQEEFEKLFPDTLMVKAYRDDAEEQKPEQPTSAVTPTVPDGVQKPSEGEMPEGNLNPSEGEKPGEPQNPSEGETPGENQSQPEGEKPGENQGPSEGEKPGENQGPSEGETPGENQGPSEGEKPGENQGPSEGEKPGENQGPSEGEKPGENQGPSEGEKPGENQNPSEGEDPGENQGPSEGETPEGDQSPSGGEKPEGNQSSSEGAVPEGNQDTSHGASADSGSSDDSGASISTSTGNADGYDSTDNNDFGDSVVIMGQMVPWAGLPENADTGADVTENDGKTGSIEAYTETAAEKVNVKDGNTESGNTENSNTEETDNQWTEITVKAWEPDEGEYAYSPEDEAGTTYCYIPVISSRYDMDTELPMIFIEITDAVIIYPTSAMESVYEKIQALPSAEEIVELVERISVATASQIPDIQGIMEQEKEAKKAYDALSQDEKDEFDSELYRKLMDLDTFFSNMKLVNTIEEQVINIRVDGGMELTGTGLEDALKDQTSDNIHSLEILGGTFSESDWHYLRNMVSLQTFIMSDSVEKEKIADMPDVSSGSIFPKTICSVELGQAARIGQNAFNACGQLHELTVPESVTSIGSNALGTGSRLVVSLPRNTGVPEGIANSITGSGSVIIRTDQLELGRALYDVCKSEYPRIKVTFSSDLSHELEPVETENGVLSFRLSASADNYDVHGIKDGKNVQTTYSNNGYYLGVCAGKEPTKFSDCTSIKNLEREPVFVELKSGEILAAGISADFVSDGKYLKVTHTLVNVSDKTMERVCIGVNADIQIGSNDAASIYRTGTGFRMEDPGSQQQFSLACKKAPGADDISTMWFGYYSDRQSNQFNDTSADDLIGSDSGLAFSWKDMELSPGERITRSVLFSVGEIADPPVLSKDPFSFTLEAEGKKSIKVDARVTDKAGRTDSIYYTIKKDGQPQQEERNLASVLADGSEKTITGVIGEAEFPDDGTYIVNVWIMNDAGAISEAVTREIVVENGQITAGIDGAAPIVDVTVTLSAPSDLVYSGEEKAASAVSAGADLTEEDYTVNYTRTTDSGQSVPVGHAPVSAGSYTAVFALTESGAQKYELTEDSVTAISYIIKPKPVSITVSGRKVYQSDPIGDSGFIVTWPGDEGLTDAVKASIRSALIVSSEGNAKEAPAGSYDIRITQIQVNGDADNYQVMPEVIPGGFLVESVHNPVLSLSAPKDITPNSAMLEGIILLGNVPLKEVTVSYKKAGTEDGYQIVNHELSQDSDMETVSVKAALAGLDPETDYQVKMQISYEENGGGGIKTHEQLVRFRTAALNGPLGEISGTVTDNSGMGDTLIYVTLERGNTVQAGAGPLQSPGQFKFEGLPDGFYNLVANNGYYRVTQIVEIKSGNSVAGIQMSIGKTQSIIEIATEDTPEVVAGGLNELFHSELYTQSDADVVRDGGTVEFKLRVENKPRNEVAQDAERIAQEMAPGGQVGMYLDLQVLKTVKNAAGVTAGDHETPVPDLKGKKLTIVIPLPEEIRNRAPYFVYKVHGGTVSAVDNTYQEEHHTLTIRADEFSTYAIAYTQETEETAGAVQAEHDSGTVREGRWMQNDTGWWYAYSNGTWPSARWAYLYYNGRYDWYYFDPKGYMKDGWIEIGGKWYYLHKLYDGRRGYMYTGLRQIDGKIYFFGSDGVMFSGGWKNVDGHWRYFNADGSMAVNAVVGGCKVNQDGIIIN